MIIHLSDLNKVPIGVCNYLFAGEKKKIGRYVAMWRAVGRRVAPRLPLPVAFPCAAEAKENS